jgi:hypothetical protein
MTQDVNIASVAGRGYPPAWATENTLANIANSSDKSMQYLKIIGRELASDSDHLLAEIRKIAGELKDGHEENKKTDLDDKNNSEENIKELRNLNKAQRDSILALRSTTDSKSLFGNIKAGLNSVGYQMKFMNHPLADMITGFGVVAGVVDELWHKIVDLNKSWESLYATGLIFDNGMNGLISAANNAGMTVENFSKMLTKFGAVAGTLGVKRLSDLNKQFLDNTKSGSELMMTQEEANEAFLGTVELMRSSGKLTSMSDKEIVESGKNLLKNYNELAEATGRNRDEIAKSTQDIIRESNVNVLSRLIPKEQQEQFQKQIAGYAAAFGDSGKELASASAQIRLAGGSMGTLTGDMATIVNQVPGLYDALNATDTDAPKRAAMAFGHMDPQAVADLMVQFPEAGKWINEMTQKGQALVEIQDLQAKQDAGTLTEKERQRKLDLESQQKILEAHSKVNAAMANFQNSIGRVAMSFSHLLMPAIKLLSTTFDAISWTIDKVSDLFDGISNTISGWLKSLNIDDNAADIAGSAGAAIGIGVIGTSVLKWLMGAGGGLFTRMLSWGPFGKISGLLSKTAGVAGKAGGGILGGIGDGIGKIGKGLGGLGKGVGVVIESILGGLAAGLIAFANPEILLGAAILSASIAILGAGISGAIWIISKSLPSLADGMQSFANLDGSALILAGKGMVAIGAGLVAMTAGTVIDGLGGLITGITGLFKEDPIDKLKKFASVGEPLKLAADALQLLADSMPKAINAISSLNNVDFSGMDKLRASLAPIPTQSTGFLSSLSNLVSGTAPINNAGIESPTVPTTNIDRAAIDYYEKSTKQFARMIELLEIANGHASKLVDVNQDGHSDVVDAITAASGSIF